MSKAPKLRFKEFSGDWEKKKIGEITTKVGSGKTPKGGNSVYTDSGVIFLRSQNVLNGKLNLSDVAYITEEINSTMKSTEVYGDDILLNITGASIGRSCNVPKNFPKANVNQHVCIIRLNEHYNSNFIMNQIISEKVQRQIDSYQAGGNREGLNFEQIKSIKVDSTCIEEQEKIASFFSLIDDKISLQGEKLEMLKDYKRGVLQKIFSRELRFKDDEGRDYPEWEEKKLGDCIENKGGTALEKFVDENGTHKFISIGNYSTSGKYIDSGQRISLNDKTKDKLLYKNDLVMVLNDKTATGDLIGSTILIDEDNTYIYNQRSERLICNENINPDFAWILLNYEDFRKKVFSIAQGGTQIYVNFPSVKNLNIQLPSLKEQNKISELILALDNKIEKEQEKLDSLNEYKKGLLQQMFV